MSLDPRVSAALIGRIITVVNILYNRYSIPKSLNKAIDNELERLKIKIKADKNEYVNQRKFEIRKEWESDFLKSITELLSLTDPYLLSADTAYKNALPTIHKTQILLNYNLEPHKELCDEITKVGNKLQDLHEFHEDQTRSIVTGKRATTIPSDFKESLFKLHASIHEKSRNLIYQPDDTTPIYESQVEDFAEP